MEARCFQVKGRCPSRRENSYRPGMLLTADVVLQSKKNVLAIPTASITQQSDGDFVYIIKNDRSFLKKIKTGLSDESVDGGLTEITEGLSKGDAIVIAGMNNLTDSTKVSIVK